MKTNSIFSALFVCVVLVVGCQPTDEVSDTIQAEDQTGSQIAFQLLERDLIPEGIAYDPVSDTFFLSSIRKSKILRISRDGTVETFVPSGHGGIWAVVGMRVDVERRLLWANSTMSRFNEQHDPEATQMTGIFKYSLEDGSFIKSYTLEKTERSHTLNDVAVARDGSVYITSTAYGTLYTIDSVTDELTEFLPMPEDIMTNGIDITPDQQFLFVVGSQSIFRVSLATKEILELEIPEGEFIGWGDGLYFHNDYLVAITYSEIDEQTVLRVLKLYLSEDLEAIERVEELENNHPLFVNPTTGTIVDNWFFYVATAQFSKFDENGIIAPWDELSDTIILKLKLE